jgi:hypothetical protein
MTNASLAAPVFWRLTPDAPFLTKRQGEPTSGARSLDVDDMPQRGKLQRSIPQGISVQALADEKSLQVHLEVGSAHSHPIPT